MAHYDSSEMDPVLRNVCSQWLMKIEHARRVKWDEFQHSADDCMSFYRGPKDLHEWSELMGASVMRAAEGEGLSFRMNVNKAFELVTLFGPAMYAANPVRTCKPRAPVQIPPEFFQDQYQWATLAQQEDIRLRTDGLRSIVIEAYLNWSPNAYDLSGNARAAIDEALLKGRGCLWTEVRDSPGGQFRGVCSEFDSVDHLFIDPDAKDLKSATWIARKCILPTWQVERDYGLRPGSLKGNVESQARQADVEVDPDGLYERRKGLTNDLIVYYKVWSKMGIGGRLQGIARNVRAPLEMFGDFAYLVIASGVGYPLNLSPDVSSDPNLPPEEAFAKVAWPTPFWADGGWPVSCLDFHKIPNRVWPLAHLQAGMGELKFLHWAYSFMAGHVRNASRDLVCVLKSMAEEFKTAILSGRDLELIEIEKDHAQSFEEVVQFLKHPPMNKDIFSVLDLVERNFDKRTGLSELLYGNQGDTQIRSAEEANLRNSNSMIRPQDMSDQVEAWMAEVAAKEAATARYHLQGADVAPALGPMAQSAWDTYVVSSDLVEVFTQLEYRIESGSTKRPNKDFQVRQMGNAIQTLSPIYQVYAQQTGDWSPLNALLADFAKAQDLDPERYQLSAAPLPPQLPSPAGGTPEPSRGGLDLSGTQAPQQGPQPAQGAPQQGSGNVR